jgi:hypothetical protein
MSKICIIIFFFAFAGVAFAHGKASKRQPLPDSTKIYEQLIEMEDEDAHYGRNIAGIVGGSTLVGLGTVCLFSGIYFLKFHDKEDNAWDEFVDETTGLGALIFAVPLYMAGIPILAYNIYTYSLRKEHAKKRDVYKRDLKYYNMRHHREKGESVQMSLFPSVDVIHSGGGLNLLMAF